MKNLKKRLVLNEKQEELIKIFCIDDICYEAEARAKLYNDIVHHDKPLKQLEKEYSFVLYSDYKDSDQEALKALLSYKYKNFKNFFTDMLQHSVTIKG